MSLRINDIAPDFPMYYIFKIIGPGIYKGIFPQICVPKSFFAITAANYTGEAGIKNFLNHFTTLFREMYRAVFEQGGQSKYLSETPELRRIEESEEGRAWKNLQKMMDQAD